MFIYIFTDLFNVYQCFACLHVWAPRECLLDTLKLGLWMVVSRHMGTRN